jgi:hypothetical protein
LKTILKYCLLALVLSLTVPRSARALDHDALALDHDVRALDQERHSPKDPRNAPEVDPSLAISGLALLGGALAVALVRRSKG